MAKDLTGQLFGKLTALRPTEERKNGFIVWECLCDCGNTKFAKSGALTSGRVKSCGCLAGERANDLARQRFGKLTAIRPVEERRNSYIVWECICDCGESVLVNSANLLTGNTKSCGCLKIERVKKSRTKDLTGQRFGKLVAIRPTEERSRGCVVWECLCDCGNTKLVSSRNLPNGEIQSCGCIRTGKVRETITNDLTGQRFGRLTAVRPTGERKYSRIVWECLCDCGNTKFVSTGDLSNGKTQSCGCLRTEQVRKAVTKDLTGQKFGRLTAVRPTEQRRNGRVVWECLCDCGNTAYVSVSNLLAGNTKSCGCLRKTRAKKDNIDCTGGY